MAGPRTQPQDLRRPVPGVDQAAMQQEAQAQIDLPQGSSTANVSDDDLSQFLFGGAVPQEDAAVPEQVPVGATVPTTGPVTDDELSQLFSTELSQAAVPQASVIPLDQRDYSQDFDNFFQRMRLSFAGSDKEVVQELKQLGFESQKSGNKVFWRRNSEEKWKPFDSDKTDFLNDWIADNARTILETGSEILGATAGGALGSVLPGAGTVSGAAAGSALTGAAATLMSDAIAEHMLDIERDPERSRSFEVGSAALLGGVFGAAGKGISNILKSRAAKKVAVDVMTEDYGVLRGRVQETLEAVKSVNDTVFKSVDGMKIHLAPHQVIPGNPEYLADATELTSKQGFRNFLENQGELIREGYTDLSSMIAQSSGEGRLFQRVKDAVKSETQFEGSVLGEFRERAIRASGDEALEVPSTRGMLDELTEELGIRYEGDEILTSAQDIVDVTGLDDKTADSILKTVARLDRMQKTKQGLTFKDVVAQKKILQKKIDNNIVSNPAGARYYLRLKDALGNDEKGLISDLLPRGSRAAYEESLSRYSEIKTQLKDLNSMLKKNSVSQEALIDDVFKNARKLPQIQAVKSIVQSNDPQLWGDLIAEKLNSSIRKATDSKTGKVLWTKVKKEYDSLGKETLDTMLEGSGINQKQFKDFLTVAEKASSADLKMLPLQQKQTLFRKLFLVVASPFWSTRSEKFMEAMSILKSDKELIEFIGKTNIDDLLTSVPKKKRSAVKNSVLKGIKTSLGGVGKTVSREQVREREVQP